MEIRAATAGDWPAIRQIYVEGIRTGHATFETEADIPDGPAWFAEKLPGLAFVAEDDRGRLIGWCALSPVSDRCVYEGVAEVSVYVAGAAQGKGVGTALLDHLITASEADGIWTLQAGIFPENEISVHVHKKAGFRIVGVRERLGKLDGLWRDVLLLERRSPRL